MPWRLRLSSVLAAATVSAGCASIPAISVDEPWRDHGVLDTAPDSGDSARCADDDGDGFCPEDGDCSDDPAVNPGKVEVCNGVDDNCDGQVDEGVLATFYLDSDGDGFGAVAGSAEWCEPPAGYVTNNVDCDDTNAATWPGALEACDGLDNDCDGDVDEGLIRIFYADLDGDTYGDAANPVATCEEPVGLVSDATDCDDGDATVHPGAPELCDGLDNDCDGAFPVDEVDIDGDTEFACGEDCDDAEPLAWEGAIEEAGDGVDNDCDGGVDTDPPTCDVYVRHDSESVQAAIDAAGSGDVICVAGGTYVESLDFGGAAVTLWGVHGAATTILDGGGVGRVVQFVSAEGADSVLTGFTVQNGLIDAGDGAGILIEDASPTLTELVVTHNETFWSYDQDGGGIAVLGGAPTLTHLVVSDNRAYVIGGMGYRYGYGGGLYLEADDSVIENLTVLANNAGWSGGGLALIDSTAAIFGCDILENGPVQAGGGGAYVSAGAPSFDNVRISGNSAVEDYGETQGGGLFLWGTDASFTNVVIRDNSSWGVSGAEGGGVYIIGAGSPAFVNVVIEANTTIDDGGGLYVWSGTPTFRYGDIYGNTPDDVVGIPDPAGTDGNVSVDPSYADAYLHLATTSALVDAGDPSLLDPDGSTSDIGLFGGPSAGDRDLDGDGWGLWWLPGAYDAATSPEGDCNDGDATVFPGAGC